MKSIGAKECKDVGCKTWPKHDGDAFDKNNDLAYLMPASDLKQRELAKSPRVGLTLKRYDLEKEKYWMADYRYLTYPELCRKMNCLIQVSMLADGRSPLEVKDKLKLKTNTIDLGKLKDTIHA